MKEKKLLELVGHWQEFLGLSHWEIGVDFDTATDANATVWRPHYYDKGVVITLNSEWRTWDSQRANEIIVHELLHLVLRDLEVAMDSVERLVPKKAWVALNARFDHEIEGAVDRLALKFVELANS
ncbi:MAG TPA: hypothetical protein VLA89_06530 [Gemmatimonadales bacterium]|nr:hypothetical protein [Gemmatimonadales bacterium]